MQKQKDPVIRARKSELQQIVKEQVEQALAKELPHQCWTCKWFDFPEDSPNPHNKACLCPDKIIVIDRECANWRLQPDPNKRQRRIY